MKKKTINICCEGADFIELNDLIPFQGDLKILSDESYDKLKNSILTLGFSFPIDAWKDKKKIYVMDAHQRVETLKRMRDDDGYSIPKLPVSWVHAKNRQEAAKKVLAAASQYGEVTNDGLYQFMNENNLNMDTIMMNFNFPEINIDQFKIAYNLSEEQMHEVSFKAKSGSKELKYDEFNKFDHTCPKCKFQWNEDGKKNNKTS